MSTYPRPSDYANMKKSPPLAFTYGYPGVVEQQAARATLRWLSAEIGSPHGLVRPGALGKQGVQTVTCSSTDMLSTLRYLLTLLGLPPHIDGNPSGYLLMVGNPLIVESDLEIPVCPLSLVFFTFAKGYYSRYNESSEYSGVASLAQKAIRDTTNVTQRLSEMQRVDINRLIHRAAYMLCFEQINEANTSAARQAARNMRDSMSMWDNPQHLPGHALEATWKDEWFIAVKQKVYQFFVQKNLLDTDKAWLTHPDFSFNESASIHSLLSTYSGDDVVADLNLSNRPLPAAVNLSGFQLKKWKYFGNTKGMKLDTCTIEDSELGLGLNLNGAKDLNVKNSTITRGELKNIINCTFENCHFKEVVISGNLTLCLFINCTFISCLIPANATGSPHCFVSGQFYACAGLKAKHLDPASCTYMRLKGVPVSESSGW